jgi:hypothetical protein
MKFIHYGDNIFDKDLFMSIKDPNWKPRYGFWASPINAKYGWKDWCIENNDSYFNENESFTFTLTSDARILTIDNTDSVDKLLNTLRYIDWFDYYDFELLTCNYDAILFIVSNDWRIYEKLYSLDCYCDSLLVMNPDIIVPEY